MHHISYLLLEYQLFNVFCSSIRFNLLLKHRKSYDGKEHTLTIQYWHSWKIMRSPSDKSILLAKELKSAELRWNFAKCIFDESVCLLRLKNTLAIVCLLLLGERRHWRNAKSIGQNKSGSQCYWVVYFQRNYWHADKEFASGRSYHIKTMPKQ